MSVEEYKRLMEEIKKQRKDIEQIKSLLCTLTMNQSAHMLWSVKECEGDNIEHLSDIIRISCSVAQKEVNEITDYVKQSEEKLKICFLSF